MECKPSPDEGEKVSPSQDTICLLEPSKRDIESLEDFEDLTKDISSMKDIVKQPLENENLEKIHRLSDDSLPPFGENIDVKPNDNDQSLFDRAQSSSNSQLTEENKEPVLDTFISGEKNFSDSVRSFSNKSPEKLHQDEYSKNFINFEQDNLRPAENDNESVEQFLSLENFKSEPLTDIFDKNELINHPSYDGLSNASDDLSFTPKKGESSPVLPSGLERDLGGKPLMECRSEDGKEISLKSLQSNISHEPAVNMESSQERLQGDGFHIKESDDADFSDGDDFVPEPIPKDYPEIGAIEGKQFLAAIGLDTWFHPDMLNPKIESLIYWRDPKKSGVVFGSVMVILLSLTTFSLISVVAYTALTVLVAALGFRIYKIVLQAVQKTSEGHPFKTYLLPVLNHSAVSAVFMSVKEYLDFDLTLNPDRAREISDVVVSYLNWAVSKCRSLFLVEDVVDSVKFGICLWCLTYVGAWFNGLSLLIIAFVGLFTLPKVYENNKTQIDTNLDIVRSKINEVTDKIRAVSPIGKKTEEAKDKSE